MVFPPTFMLNSAMPPHQIMVPCRLCRNLFAAYEFYWSVEFCKYSPCLICTCKCTEMAIHVIYSHVDIHELLQQVTGPVVLFTIFLFSCKILYRTTALPSSLYFILKGCHTGLSCLSKDLILDHCVNSPVCIFLLCKSLFYCLHLSLFLAAIYHSELSPRQCVHITSNFLTATSWWFYEIRHSPTSLCTTFNFLM